MALTNITFPASVTNIGAHAFQEATNLRALFFAGNSPSVDGYDTFAQERPTVYRLAGTSGWSNTFDGFDALLPVVVWNPLFQISGANIGISNHQFNFTITNRLLKNG
jgi:hypothetical protein